jgi:hypothetical protein
MERVGVAITSSRRSARTSNPIRTACYCDAGTRRRRISSAHCRPLADQATTLPRRCAGRREGLQISTDTFPRERGACGGRGRRGEPPQEVHCDTTLTGARFFGCDHISCDLVVFTGEVADPAPKEPTPAGVRKGSPSVGRPKSGSSRTGDQMQSRCWLRPRRAERALYCTTPRFAFGCNSWDLFVWGNGDGFCSFGQGDYAGPPCGAHSPSVGLPDPASSRLSVESLGVCEFYGLPDGIWREL